MQIDRVDVGEQNIGRLEVGGALCQTSIADPMKHAERGVWSEVLRILRNRYEPRRIEQRHRSEHFLRVAGPQAVRDETEADLQELFGLRCGELGLFRHHGWSSSLAGMIVAWKQSELTAAQ